VIVVPSVDMVGAYPKWPRAVQSGVDGRSTA
jgi:hypothetical protein